MVERTGSKILVDETVIERLLGEGKLMRACGRKPRGTTVGTDEEFHPISHPSRAEDSKTTKGHRENVEHRWPTHDHPWKVDGARAGALGTTISRSADADR